MTGSDDRESPPPGSSTSDETEEGDVGPGEAPAPPPPAAGETLGHRYALQRVLGRGGNGVVFAASDLVTGDVVAIKVLLHMNVGRRRWLKRLGREVRLARAIHHPNVCRVFELGQAGGHAFVIAELATGGTLRDLLRDDARTLTWAERLTLARAACAGLSAIHAVGIIHRDVTPQNMLIMGDGRLAITDFGLAIGEKDTTTVHGGTPSYLPPEVALGGKSDLRSDVWQLGVILHEILFGGRPQWVERGGRRALRPPVAAGAPAVEAELARLCADCLAIEPSQRPPTAVAVAGRLAAAEAARPRSWLARRLLRGRELIVRHGRALGAVALIVAVTGVGARLVGIARRPALCRGAPQKLAGVWDEATRRALAAAFARARAPSAAETSARVAATLDRYASDWTSAYVDACEATAVRGEQSAEVLDLRMACLGARVGELGALTRVLVDADDDVVRNAVKATTSLVDLGRCADLAALRAVVPPPEGEAARARVGALRAQLAEVKALGDAGRTREALEKANGVARDAEAAGYAPVFAEALFRQGMLQESPDPALAARTLERALWAAEGARDDELAAEIAIALVYISSYVDASFEASERWQRFAEALLQRLGGHDLLRSWLDNNASIVLQRRHRDAEALELARQGLALKERLPGLSPYDVARSTANLSLALEGLGRHDEALAEADRTLAIFRQSLGARHPDVAAVLNNRGEILNALGRWRDAETAFDEALAIWRANFGDDSIWTAYALTGRGTSLLGERRAAEAVPVLERALAVRARSGADPEALGDSGFALARALGETGREPERARRLAEKARADLAKAGAPPKRLAEVDAWLASSAARRSR
jgi:serine/threonine-protein kinase